MYDDDDDPWSDRPRRKHQVIVITVALVLVAALVIAQVGQQ